MTKTRRLFTVVSGSLRANYEGFISYGHSPRRAMMLAIENLVHSDTTGAEG